MTWNEPEGGYKVFKIGDLFKVVKGKRLTKAHMLPGEINFIGATSTRNGVTAKIANSSHLHPAGTITVSYNGSVGEAFYQTKNFWASDDVNVLYPKIPMNKYVALYFLAPLIKKGKSYAYSFKWTKKKMEEDCIYLPITKSGNIDLKYIEKCMRELEEERICEFDAYLSEAGFEDCELTSKEKKALQSFGKGRIRNKIFKIDSLFNIATGRDIIIGRTRGGDIPLISHQHDDNGISKRIERLTNRRLFDFEKTLPLADRGVFLATTQAEDFHIGTRVKALTFKDGKHSENIRLFFVAAINKLQVLFVDYLTNATDNLPDLQISVPITKSGGVDYDFMDTYINAIKKQCISALKQEITREHNEYKQAVVLPLSDNETEQVENKTIVFPEYREGCVPLYTLQAACGGHEDGELPEVEGWVDAYGNGFTPDPKRHFAIHAKGDSMSPKIQDGDICVFEWYQSGSREGEIVLNQIREHDPVFEGPYTIKEYHSVKKQYEDGSWEHVKINLIPLNKDYDVIELNGDEEYRTIGIFKCVLR